MSWVLIYCFLGGWTAPMPAADTLYGTYIISEEKISLKLSPPDNYTLFVMDYDKRTEAVTSQELSRGVFEMRRDTLILEDMASGKAMKLLVTSEEQLHPLNVPGLDDDITFLGHNQYYPNGELKWEGAWRRGKKHGNWIYYNDSGDVVETVRYRRGKKKN